MITKRIFNGQMSEKTRFRKKLVSTQKDRIGYGKPQGDKFEFSKQGRLPSISVTVDIGNASTKPRKALKADSILVLKRYESYNNSLSSVKFDLVWVRVPPPRPIFFTRQTTVSLSRSSSIGRAISVWKIC